MSRDIFVENVTHVWVFFFFLFLIFFLVKSDLLGGTSNVTQYVSRAFPIVHLMGGQA